MVCCCYGNMSLSLDAWRQICASGMSNDMFFLLSVGKIIIGLEAFLLQHIVTLFTVDMTIIATFSISVAIF